jgi:hypothetical protein
MHKNCVLSFFFAVAALPFFTGTSHAQAFTIQVYKIDGATTPSGPITLRATDSEGNVLNVNGAPTYTTPAANGLFSGLAITVPSGTSSTSFAATLSFTQSVTAPTNAMFANGAPSIAFATSSFPTSVQIGNSIAGTGIQDQTTVTNIVSASGTTTVTLSAGATGTGGASGTQITFYGTGFAGKNIPSMNFKGSRPQTLNITIPGIN